MKVRSLDTARGARIRVFEAGTGTPLVFLHGAGGLLPENPFLDRLAERYHVFAPELPGYGESIGEELLEDMLDFALHGWDVIDALGLERPHLVGHSMGGMIAAEMACLGPRALRSLALIGAAGLWIAEHPIPDIFSFLPYEYIETLFHNRAAGEALLTGGLDLRNPDALMQFYVAHTKRLSMAGKILFPIPNRRLSKRLYRVTTPTLLLWGKHDRFIPPIYADRFQKLLPNAQLRVIDAAGHMLPYEQPDALVAAITSFLA
jgi:pimeloyl-ACP methyl ester carboxylesterase